MKKQTQKKTNNNQKKRRTRLLATWIPVGAVVVAGATTGIVFGVKSCNNGLNVVYVTQDENLGTFTVDGAIGKDTTITFNPKPSYELDADTVVVSVDDRNLTKGTDYTVDGNVITIKGVAVTSKNIKVRGRAKINVPPTPVEGIVSLSATGFRSRLKGSILKHTDLTVTAKLSTGETKELSCTAGDYKVYITLIDTEYRDLGDQTASIKSGLTLSNVGLYQITIKYAYDETITCTNMISVSDTKSCTVNYVQTLKDTFTLDEATETVKLTENVEESKVSFAVTRQTAATNPVVSTRFVVTTSESETITTDNTVYTSEWFAASDATQHTISFYIDDWSKVQNIENLYVHFMDEDTLEVQYLATDKGWKIDEETATFAAGPAYRNITFDAFNDPKTSGAESVEGYFKLWYVPSNKESVKQFVVSSDESYTLTEKAAESVTLTIPETFNWVEPEDVPYFEVEFVEAKAVTIDTTALPGTFTTTLETNTIYDDDGYRTVKFKVKSSAPLTGSFVLKYSDLSTSVTTQMGILLDQNVTTEEKEFSFEATNWPTFAAAGTHTASLLFVETFNVPVEVNTTAFGNEGLICTRSPETISFATPTITTNVTYTEAPTKHYNLIATVKDTDTVVGRVDNVDFTTTPTNTITISDWSKLENGNTITISLEETTKKITLEPDSSVTSKFDVSYSNDTNIVTSEETEKLIFFKNNSDVFSNKGDFYLYSVKKAKRTHALTGAEVAASATKGLRLVPQWDQFDYEDTLILQFEPDEDYKECKLTVSEATDKKFRIDSISSVVNSETKKLSITVTNISDKKYNAQLNVHVTAAYTFIYQITGVTAGETRTVEIDLPAEFFNRMTENRWWSGVHINAW